MKKEKTRQGKQNEKKKKSNFTQFYKPLLSIQIPKQSTEQKFFIKFTGVTLGNGIIQVSSVHFCVSHCVPTS